MADQTAVALVGLAIPDFVMLDESSDLQAVESQLGLPLFVKPASKIVDRRLESSEPGELSSVIWRP